MTFSFFFYTFIHKTPSAPHLNLFKLFVFFLKCVNPVLNRKINRNEPSLLRILGKQMNNKVSKCKWTKKKGLLEFVNFFLYCRVIPELLLLSDRQRQRCWKKKLVVIFADTKKRTRLYFHSCHSSFTPLYRGVISGALRLCPGHELKTSVASSNPEIPHYRLAYQLHKGWYVS